MKITHGWDLICLNQLGNLVVVMEKETDCDQIIVSNTTNENLYNFIPKMMDKIMSENNVVVWSNDSFLTWSDFTCQLCYDLCSCTQSIFF